jgi:predicted transposase/invertase (TIGR01784 family)
MKAKYVNPFTDFGFKEPSEIAKYSAEERYDYEQSLKMYRDLKSVIDTAFDEGKIAVARNLKSLGVDITIIAQSTGLTKEAIEKL